MNWGWKIAIAYGSFVVFMLFMVIMSARQDFGMVTPDYYAKELEYPEKMEKMSNANALGTALSVKYQAESKAVAISFPEHLEKKRGMVKFYRPSNPKLDFEIPIETKPENVQLVDASKLQKGLWQVQLDWESGGKGYYKDITLVLP